MQYAFRYVDGDHSRMKVMELKKSRTSSILELNYQVNLMVYSATHLQIPDCIILAFNFGKPESEISQPVS